VIAAVVAVPQAGHQHGTTVQRPGTAEGSMSYSIPVWPPLAVADWADTRDTLQLMTQIVGKIRLANASLMNHWWNVALYVSARGLTTGLIPHGHRAFQMDIDFHDHQLQVATTDGDRQSIVLQPRPIAEFYSETMQVLDQLNLSTDIWTMPVEIIDAIPFEADQQHGAYDRVPYTAVREAEDPKAHTRVARQF
jgi:hypothetical protein